MGSDRRLGSIFRDMKRKRLEIGGKGLWGWVMWIKLPELAFIGSDLNIQLKVPLCCRFLVISWMKSLSWESQAASFPGSQCLFDVLSNKPFIVQGLSQELPLSRADLAITTAESSSCQQRWPTLRLWEAANPGASASLPCGKLIALDSFHHEAEMIFPHWINIHSWYLVSFLLTNFVCQLHHL